jgi:activating signal cointegrator complex subunit 3
MKSNNPNGICVYIAPLKALARERLKAWQNSFGRPPLNWRVLELSGDTSHDQIILQNADILICTPEKWDLISRGWRGRVGASGNSSGKDFVTRVHLLVLDEVHLLGEDRGAVLEAIVSRTRFISRYNQCNERKISEDANKSGFVEATRILGLSTALANPTDLADWIGIETGSADRNSLKGMYNFKPSVRPVPTKVSVKFSLGILSYLQKIV